MAAHVKTIDGSVLEGGGQILRISAALSCLLKQPIKVHSIRAGRSNPGLRPQHQKGLQLISSLCNGCLEKDVVGSTEVTLTPGDMAGGTYNVDTKTAGSICLLLQAALPCCLYTNSPTTLNLRGGTNADMAPPVDYYTWVFGPIAKQFGVSFDCKIIKRGYYPKGGGEVSVLIKPTQSALQAVTMTERGHITAIRGLSFVNGTLPAKVAHIMADVARHRIQDSQPGVPVDIKVVKEPPQAAQGNGCAIIIVAETSTGCLLAGTGLGRRGVAAEQVGEEAAEMLLNNLEHQGCVDEHLQDQLVILMALAEGQSRVRCGPITQHTQTAIHITELLTQAKFEVKPLGKHSNEIICDGIGLTYYS